MAVTKEARRKKIRSRIRGKIRGTAERPRLSVYRSNKEIYVQIINDDNGTTLAAASSRDKDFTRSGNKVEQAKALEKLLQPKLLKKVSAQWCLTVAVIFITDE